ncbi:hypothetical protein CTU88_14745 [Streptomyces sp. JV178]|uniref:hypothetical protein n=1 Tax=Streptomyces sp. JV178 TaxID=858632 RepID=UPI000C1B1905|nr:hypothetical protein [Streptomyces sp. JV178]PIM71349.1 hypothetical protein CTU88_14745 [Streptomyces sp. JV178]
MTATDDEDAVESGLGEDLGLTTLPAVIPLVSALTWRRPISTHLCVLTCGLTSRLCSAAKP